MLKVGVKPPVPSMTEFLTFFEALFGGEGGGELEPADAARILEALHDPFLPGEVEQAAGLMASGKSSALATYPIEFLKGHSSGV